MWFALSLETRSAGRLGKRDAIPPASGGVTTANEPNTHANMFFNGALPSPINESNEWNDWPASVRAFYEL